MRWFAALLLALYAVLVARLTLADPATGRPFFDAGYYWSALLSGGRLGIDQVEALLNIALFVPAGFLLAVVLQRPLAAAGLCVLASCCIELAQQAWLPNRVATFADVEHNSIGAGLGVLAFAVAAWGIRWLSGSPRSAGQPA